MVRTALVLSIATLLLAPAGAADANPTTKLREFHLERDGDAIRVFMNAVSDPAVAPASSAVALAFDHKGGQHKVTTNRTARGRYTYMFWLKPHGTSTKWGTIIHKAHYVAKNEKGEHLGEPVEVAMVGGGHRHHNWISLSGVRYLASMRAKPAPNPNDKGKKALRVELTINTSAPGQTKPGLPFDGKTAVTLTVSGPAIKGGTATVTATPAEHRATYIGTFSGEGAAKATNAASAASKATLSPAATGGVPALGGADVGHALAVVGVGLDSAGQPATSARLRNVLVGARSDGRAFGDATHSHLAYRHLSQVDKKGRGVYQFNGRVAINGNDTGADETFNFIWERGTGDKGEDRRILVFTNTSGKLKDIANSTLVVTLAGTKSVVNLKLAGKTELKKGNFTTIGGGNSPPPVLISSWGAVLE